MSNINIYKMFGMHLILILSKIFIIIIFLKNVLLLTDIFEKFISSNSKYYGLESSHYFSVSGLSWDTMLKMTKIELEKINDPNKYMFF